MQSVKMWLHELLSDTELHSRIRKQSITFGGNKKLKIFGRLDCTSGKRMKRANRVFFATAAEAEIIGYRPCGHCLREAYQNWKLKQQR